MGLGPGIVSADKIACCTFDNAMGTGQSVAGGNLSNHVSMTVRSTVKNSRDNPSDSPRIKSQFLLMPSLTLDSAMVALHAHGGVYTCTGLP